MSTRILCVDDDANILAGYQRSLRKQIDLEVAVGPEAGLEALKSNGPFAVVVADMQMPGMNGIDFLIETRKLAPDSVRMMLTGNADQRTAVEAVNRGHVFRFLTKPCPPEDFALVLQTGLRQYELITAEKQLLEQTLNGSVNMLTEILALTDSAAFGRSQTLRNEMRVFLDGIGAPSSWACEMAALLSPAGQVTIPPDILARSRAGAVLKLNEQEIVNRAPETAANLLKNIPRLEPVAEIIRYQGKHFDGAGFPQDDVAGEQIPIGSRILHLLLALEDYDRRGVSRQDALNEMQRLPGRYDPRVIDAAFKCFDIYLAQTTDAVARIKEIPFRELHAGMVLAADLYTKNEILLMGAGCTLTPVMLEKVRNFARLYGILEPITVED